MGHHSFKRYQEAELIAKSPRELALSVLLAVLDEGAYSNLKLDQTLRQHDLSIQDTNFVTNLVYGVLQHKLTLEYQVQPFLRTTKPTPSWVLVVLNIAVYQMFYLDRVPVRAAIFEAVKIGKIRGNGGIGNLINAILRNVQRQGFRDPKLIENTNERLSIQYSVPAQITAMLTAQLGLAKTEAILTAVNQPPLNSVRVNTTVTTVAKAQVALRAADFDVTASSISDVGLIAPSGHLANTALFQNGAIVMQDESAQLVAPALQVQPSDYVLDACAAPGGKTTQIATYLDPNQGGKVLALDLYDQKIKLINQNAKRQHVADLVVAQQMDARQVSDHYPAETFDKVLVDAPCSGIGLIRRKPEIRYRKEIADFKNLQKLQLQILESAAWVLKQNGRLVYSTCTIVQEENDAVVAAFLKRHPNFSLEQTYTKANLTTANKTLTIYPDDYNSDGFFIASLKRN